MSIPLDGNDVLEFTPPSLECMGGDAPKFFLKAASERDAKAFRYLMARKAKVQEVNSINLNELRIEAIARLWPTAAASLQMRFRTVLASAEQGVQISDDDAKWFNAIVKDISENDDEVGDIEFENGEYQSAKPRISIMAYVSGWAGFESQFVNYAEDYGVAARAAAAMMGELYLLGTKHKIEPPFTPLLELYGAVERRLNFLEDEVKNSSAPLPLSSTETALTEPAPPLVDGESHDTKTATTLSSSSSEPTILPDAG